MQLTPRTASRLAEMALSLEKHSVRSYGTRIGLNRGMAAVTDGFGLLAWSNPEFADAEQVSLTPNMAVSEVRYPNFNSLIPAEGEGVEVDGESVVFLAQNWSGKGDVETSGRLVLSTEGVSLSRQEGRGDSVDFNPSILKRMLKGVGKKRALMSARLVDGEKLVLRFADDMLILVMAVKRADKKEEKVS